MTTEGLPKVTPHKELSDWYDVGEWSFDLSDEYDGNLESARESIKAWTAWVEFLERRQDEESQETLF